MGKKRKKPNGVLSARDIMKMEIAQELGIWDKVQESGWESLNNAECGRVGGIMSKRLRDLKEQK